MGEFWRRTFDKKTAAIAAGSLALGASIGAGTTAAIYENTDGNTCLSPRATAYYEGDPTADPQNQSTWTQGVEADTDIPADANAVEAGFTDPGGKWKDSQEVNPRIGRRIAFSIGHDAVTFGIRVKAKKDSPLCDAIPDTKFSKPSSYELIVLDRGAYPPPWNSRK